MKNLSLLFFLFILLLKSSIANPSGENVVSGNVSFNRDIEGVLNILQSTDKAIINWESFSIDIGELTEFVTPGASSATLNRVVGAFRSDILGQLKSNGNLILINPNGILVGPSGRIDAQGFIGSTLDIADADFLDGGDNTFKGASLAGVTNLGSINAIGGDVFIFGNTVKNDGSISAPAGTVGLAAGSEVLLTAQDSDLGRVFVKAGSGGGNVGVENNGTIDSVNAELKAHGNVYAMAIKNTGTIRANGVAVKNGRILLTANGGNIQHNGSLVAKNADGSGGKIVVNGGPASTVDLDGEVNASGSTGLGGRVVVTGENINLGPNANVRIDGTDGGIALIGFPDAETGSLSATSVVTAPGSKIDASGTAGTGGSVFVNADQTIDHGGEIKAKGVNQGGNIQITSSQGTGGAITISGSADASSDSGTGGSVTVNGDTVALNPNSNLKATGASQGGNVTATATNSLTANSANIDVSSDGSGGLVNLSGDSVAISGGTNINADGTTQGGTVLASANNDLSISGSNITANSASGNGGFVQLNGNNVAVDTTTLSANGLNSGGMVTANANNALNINASNISANSANGAGGLVNLQGSGSANIANNNIDASGASSGGSVTVTSNGDINSSANNINASSSNGNGGLVQFNGANITDTGSNINVSGLNAGGTFLAGANNNLNLTSTNIDANSLNGAGGYVELTGENIGLQGTTNVNASGITGGKILVGGDYQGANPNVRNATNTYVGPGVNLNVDGLSGNAGTAVVWADNNTAFYGNISSAARGAVGDGGTTEVSGKNNLAFNGTADLTSANGTDGSLLLDPDNIFIVDATPNPPGTNDDAFLAGGGIDGTEGLSSTGDNNYVITQAALEALTGNVTLQADQNITIENLGDNELTLLNLTGITFEAGLNFSMADAADNILTNGNVEITADTSIVVGSVATNGGTINVNPLTPGTNPNITINGALDSSNGAITIGNDGNNAISISESATIVSDGGAITIGNGLTTVEALGTVDSSGNDGGDIEIIGTNVIAENVINATGNAGDGGDVTIEAFNIAIAGVTSAGSINGGEINVGTDGATLSTEINGDLNSTGSFGNGGDISVFGTIINPETNADLTPGNVTADGGNATVTLGGANTGALIFNDVSADGGSGTIIVNALTIGRTSVTNSVITSEVDGLGSVSADGGEGTIIIGSDITGDLSIGGDVSADGGSGTINIDSTGNILAQNITADGGLANIHIGNEGSNDFTNAIADRITVASVSAKGDGADIGGNVSITALNRVDVGAIDVSASRGIPFNDQLAGNVLVTGASRVEITGDISANGRRMGGNVELRSDGRINTQGIDISDSLGYNISGFDENGNELIRVFNPDLGPEGEFEDVLASTVPDLTVSPGTLTIASVDPDLARPGRVDIGGDINAETNGIGADIRIDAGNIDVQGINASSDGRTINNVFFRPKVGGRIFLGSSRELGETTRTVDVNGLLNVDGGGKVFFDNEDLITGELPLDGSVAITELPRASIVVSADAAIGVSGGATANTTAQYGSRAGSIAIGILGRQEGTLSNLQTEITGGDFEATLDDNAGRGGLIAISGGGEVQVDGDGNEFGRGFADVFVSLDASGATGGNVIVGGPGKDENLLNRYEGGDVLGSGVGTPTTIGIDINRTNSTLLDEGTTVDASGNLAFGSTNGGFGGSILVDSVGDSVEFIRNSGARDWEDQAIDRDFRDHSGDGNLGATHVGATLIAEGTVLDANGVPIVPGFIRTGGPGATPEADGGYIEIHSENLIDFYEGSFDASSTGGTEGVFRANATDVVIADMNLGDGFGSTFASIAEGVIEASEAEMDVLIEGDDGVGIGFLADPTLDFGTSDNPVTITADFDNDGAGHISFINRGDTLKAGGRDLTITATDSLENNVIVDADGNTTIVNITEMHLGNIDTSNTGGGGDVNLTLSGTNVEAIIGNVSTNSLSGTGGVLNVEAPNITIGNINTSGVNDSTISIDEAKPVRETGGDILLDSDDNVQLFGDIDAGDGDITINGDLVLHRNKNTYKLNSIGGAVTVSGDTTTDIFDTTPALDLTFVNPDASELAGGLATVGFRDGLGNAGFIPKSDDAISNNLDLPFTVNFLDGQYDQVIVNNNGFISLSNSANPNAGGIIQSTSIAYADHPIVTLDLPIIAPFINNVDTRGANSRVVSYGFTTIGGRPAFAANYELVGRFDRDSNVQNTYQVVIIDRGDVETGAFDIEFNYDRIEWDSFINADGNEIAPGRVGFTDGNSYSYEADGSGTTAGTFVDGGENSLASQETLVFQVREGIPLAEEFNSAFCVDAHGGSATFGDDIGTVIPDNRVGTVDIAAYTDITVNGNVNANENILLKVNPDANPGGGSLNVAGNLVADGRVVIHATTPELTNIGGFIADGTREGLGFGTNPNDPLSGLRNVIYFDEGTVETATTARATVATANINNNNVTTNFVPNNTNIGNIFLASASLAGPQIDAQVNNVPLVNVEGINLRPQFNQFLRVSDYDRNDGEGDDEDEEESKSGKKKKLNKFKIMYENIGSYDESEIMHRNNSFEVFEEDVEVLNSPVEYR